jgi:CsoR family transcriptional regulator, copper-sensing transcriptional repressor
MLVMDPLPTGGRGYVVRTESIVTRTIRGADPRTKAQILARLRSIEGHWRAVIRMVDEDRYCVDVIKQIRAVEGAVEKATALLLERHLTHCVSDAIRSGTPRERERAVAELLDVFENGRGQARTGGGSPLP